SGMQSIYYKNKTTSGMTKIIPTIVILLLSASISFAQRETPAHVNVISDFKSDLAIALNTRTGKKGIINRDGKIRVALVYDEVARFENGFYKIISSGRRQRVGLVNEKGETVIKPKKFSSIWL